MVLADEIFHALHVNIGKVDDVAAGLDHVGGIFQAEAQGAQDRQSHHGRAMYPGGTMNEDARVGVVQRFQSEINSALEERRRLRLEVVVRGIPQHLHTVRAGKLGVIEFDLHVDDVSNSGADDLDHLFVGPDAAANRDTVGDPGHVHAVDSPLLGRKVVATTRAVNFYFTASGSGDLGHRLLAGGLDADALE